MADVTARDVTAREFAQLRAEKEAACGHEPVLTPRERDCLAYSADGLRTAKVAHRLGIAEATVEMHLRSARKRLGAKTRDQAIAVAVRKGWI